MRHVRRLSVLLVLILLVCIAGCKPKAAEDPDTTPTPSPTLVFDVALPTLEAAIAPVYSPEPTTSMEPRTGYCNGEGVNLRAEPNKSASIVDIMGENTVLEIISLEDGWYEVKLGEQTAYVAESLITIGEPPRNANMHWAKITAKEAQLYGAPTDADMLDTKLKKDDVLKVLRKMGDYLHVVYNRNLQCYVRASDADYISEEQYNAGFGR